MSHSILEYLEHIEKEAVFLVENSKDLKYADFINDEKLTRASLRSLEIIGEVSKNIPANFRAKYPKVEWSKMAGMRDKLIHAYSGVDYDIVWNVLKNQIPSLSNKKLKPLFKILTNNS